eukprot:6211773-Pleurochrysis_carterae.AAC.1
MGNRPDLSLQAASKLQSSGTTFSAGLLQCALHTNYYQQLSQEKGFLSPTNMMKLEKSAFVQLTAVCLGTSASRFHATRLRAQHMLVTKTGL